MLNSLAPPATKSPKWNGAGGQVFNRRYYKTACFQAVCEILDFFSYAGRGSPFFLKNSSMPIVWLQ